MNIIVTSLMSFGKKLLATLLTEKIIALITFKTAKAIASKTETKADDEIVAEVEKAYNK